MLFVNVNLIPMTAEKIITDQAVLVEGTRIVKIGHTDEARVPNGATVIDGKGGFLMPGLADMHMHTSEEWLGDAWPVSPLHLYLANGVTTIRDFGPTGDDPSYVLQWRNEVEGGSRIGPTIYACGPPLLGPVNNPAQIVREQQAQGFDFIKLYSFLSKGEFHEAMATATRLGMHTAGHIPFAVGLDGVLGEGMDEIAHIEELDFEFIDFDRDRDLEPEAWFAYIVKEAYQQYELHRGTDVEKLRTRFGETIPAVVGALRAAGAPVCTTMIVGATIAQKLLDSESFLARPENRYLPGRYFEAFTKGEERHQKQFRGVENLAAFKRDIEKMLLTELHRAEIPLLLSTDAGTATMGIVPGVSIHNELNILTEKGLSPYEAIATGTVNAATAVQRMTGTGNFGTVEEGRRADLLLARGNPLDDVANLKKPLGVMASGRWYPEEMLDQITAAGGGNPGYRRAA